MAILLLAVQSALAVGFLTIDADTRYRNTDFSDNTFVFEALGMTVRKVIADETADRWVLFAQFEAAENFTQTHFHQMYALFKGPLGKWNVTAGRFRFPFGLLTDYSAERMLFGTLEPYTLGKQGDDGVMFSGTIRSFNYALSVTRGAGIFDGFPQDGLVTGRMGMTLGDRGDWTVGISGAAGKTVYAHKNMVTQKRRKVGAIDVTGLLGRAEIRAEGALGLQGSDFQAAVFAVLDYVIVPPVELNTAVSVVREAGTFHHAWGFAGATFNTKIVTVKGGYKYVHYGPIDHQITLQVYKLFSFTF